MRLLYFIAISILFISCQVNQNNKADSTASDATLSASPDMPGQSTQDTIVTPTGFKKLAEAIGDLDKDNKDEIVVIYDTGKDTDMGTERLVDIFKNKGGRWKLWHQTVGAVLPSEHGGMMGDPFAGISIDRGTIVIHHFGGSSEKWTYVHRYRFQNGNWYLIGATINFGAPCNQFKNYDYNLITGKVEAKIDTEVCDDKRSQKDSTTTENFTFISKPPKPVLMEGFYPGNNEVNIENRDDSFYY